MATWHQSKHPTRLDTKDRWTVVVDPVGNPRYCYEFLTEDKAKAWIAAHYDQRLMCSAYTLPPRK